MEDQRADLDWRAGDIPVSTRFDDPYFSLDNGLAETRHVFLAGNDLPERMCDGFHVAELGFGTGLNLLATAEAWRQTGRAGHLHFTSFEAYPMTRDEMARALAGFPEVSDLAEALLAQWGQPEIEVGRVRLNLVVGDARQTLPDWDEQADAWYLDGFSPAKNPELWGAALMTAVAGKTRAGGTAATYSAAGHVRRALQEA
ncbi:MAG: tRNA (5-methylaminomethyl-2-thiouridine)(34)-methyltransferase MnmD, partial [Paracoccaceae bacterium]